MNQDELIIDYTKAEEKSPKYYHQLLFTVLISNIADILFRCVVGSFGFFAFESVDVLIITRIVLSFLESFYTQLQAITDHSMAI